MHQTRRLLPIICVSSGKPRPFCLSILICEKRGFERWPLRCLLQNARILWSRTQPWLHLNLGSTATSRPKATRSQSLSGPQLGLWMSRCLEEPLPLNALLGFPVNTCLHLLLRLVVLSVLALVHPGQPQVLPSFDLPRGASESRPGGCIGWNVVPHTKKGK